MQRAAQTDPPEGPALARRGEGTTLVTVAGSPVSPKPLGAVASGDSVGSSFAVSPSLAPAVPLKLSLAAHPVGRLGMGNCFASPCVAFIHLAVVHSGFGGAFGGPLTVAVTLAIFGLLCAAVTYVSNRTLALSSAIDRRMRHYMYTTLGTSSSGALTPNRNVGVIKCIVNVFLPLSPYDAARSYPSSGRRRGALKGRARHRRQLIVVLCFALNMLFAALRFIELVLKLRGAVILLVVFALLFYTSPEGHGVEGSAVIHSSSMAITKAVLVALAFAVHRFAGQTAAGADWLRWAASVGMRVGMGCFAAACVTGYALVGRGWGSSLGEGLPSLDLDAFPATRLEWQTPTGYDVSLRHFAAIFITAMLTNLTNASARDVPVDLVEAQAKGTRRKRGPMQDLLKEGEDGGGVLAVIYRANGWCMGAIGLQAVLGCYGAMHVVGGHTNLFNAYATISHMLAMGQAAAGGGGGGGGVVSGMALTAALRILVHGILLIPILSVLPGYVGAAFTMGGMCLYSIKEGCLFAFGGRGPGGRRGWGGGGAAHWTALRSEDQLIADWQCLDHTEVLLTRRGEGAEADQPRPSSRNSPISAASGVHTVPSAEATAVGVKRLSEGSLTKLALVVLAALPCLCCNAPARSLVWDVDWKSLEVAWVWWLFVLSLLLDYVVPAAAGALCLARLGHGGASGAPPCAGDGWQRVRLSDVVVVGAVGLASLAYSVLYVA